MKDNTNFNIIAKIHTDFPEKFGIPRQSGLIEKLKGRIIFEPEYRDNSALKGLEGFSHLWLLWKFSQSVQEDWSPTVRPPRLGGNKRVGVFATRSPFRPNPIGLSCVKIENIILNSPKGPIIEVSGADMLDGTPIYDIKPYIPYTDSHPEASGGFSDKVFENKLSVVIPDKFLAAFSEEKLQILREILASDPRPGYKQDGDRVYGLRFAEFEVKFNVKNNVLYVIEIEERK